jgi:hypothetical protein
MLPGWPQCTSQPGRSHVFTSSTNGANTAVTGSAVHEATAGERTSHQHRPPSAHSRKRSRGKSKTVRTSRQQRGEQEWVGRQRVEPRPGRPAPLAVASRRKARLLLLGARCLNPRRWQCPAARRRWWRERPPEGGARPEEKRARHRRGRHGHHPSCTLPTGYRPVTRSWSLGPGGGTTRRDRPIELEQVAARRGERSEWEKGGMWG